jgi:hypothetical protein
MMTFAPAAFLRARLATSEGCVVNARGFTRRWWRRPRARLHAEEVFFFFGGWLPRTLTFVWGRSVSADPCNGNLFDNSPDAGSAGRELSS